MNAPPSVIIGNVVVVAALLTNGLLAGTWFAFDRAIGTAFARIEDDVHLVVFRTINRTILGGTFLTVFAAAPLTGLGAAFVLAPAAQAPVAWLARAGAACAVATVLVTAIGNVPLNRRLERAAGDSADARGHARHAFETSWNRWNLARTVSSALAVTALSTAGLLH